MKKRRLAARYIQTRACKLASCSFCLLLFFSLIGMFVLINIITHKTKINCPSSWPPFAQGKKEKPDRYRGSR